MILGLSIAAFTTLHVIISLIAIASGFVVMFGMLGAHRLPGWTALFLLTTVLTSVTGFLFPIHGFTPALGTGAVSLVPLAAALLALYAKHLAGAWRWIYVVKSSSWPRRPSLMRRSVSARKASFWKNGRVNGVSMKVGASVLTRILCGASSIAMALVNPSMACLVAQ